MSSAQKILVIPLRFIGDGVLTVPLIRAIRKRHPDAQLDVLIPPHLVNLLELCPYISNILVEPRSAWEQLKLVQTGQYDMAFLMRRSVSQAGLLKLAGVKTLVGYDEQRFPPPFNYRRWGWFLDHRVTFPPVDTDIPQVKTYLSLLSPFTMETCDEHLELWTDAADHAVIQSLFDSKPLAVFHATSASREKAMAAEKFIPALQALHQDGFQIVAIGAAGDQEFYEQFSKIPLINLCGETTLRQTYALLQRTQLLFSLDSAPIHMAACAGVPHIIGIYGPTNEKQWRPYPYNGQFTAVYNTALTCRPCVPKICSHNRCRMDLTAVQLREAIEKQIVLCSSAN